MGRNIRHDRRYFRYELASSLAFLAAKDWGRHADLGAFLIAAHHGKVRMNLRAPPREPAPKDDERARARFARGIWRATSFPRWSWAAGERWDGGAVTTLSVMELGWDEATRESLDRANPDRA